MSEFGMDNLSISFVSLGISHLDGILRLEAEDPIAWHDVKLSRFFPSGIDLGPS